MKDLVERQFDGVIAPSAEQRRTCFQKARDALAEEARAEAFAPEVHKQKRKALEAEIDKINWAFDYQHWITATYLGDPAQLTATERREAYERARKDLKSQRDNADQRLSEAGYKERSEIYDWVFARLEAAHGGGTSFGDRVYIWLMDVWNSIDTKYKGLIAAMQFVADFLKPMFAVTSLMAAVSGAAALLLFSFARWAPENSAKVRRVGIFCVAVFVCSGGMMMAQRLIPRAEAQGVIGALVPGAESAQDKVLAAFARQESQNKRIGDILEAGEKRRREEALQDQRQAEEFQRQMREEELKRQREEAAQQEEQLKAVRKMLLDAGYTLDAKGYLEATADNYIYPGYYHMLNIVPNEADLRAALRTMQNPRRSRLLIWLETTTNLPFGRKVLADVEAERERLRASYPKGGTLAERTVACNPKSYAFGIDEKALAAICGKRNPREFLEAYAKLFSAIY